MSRRLVAFLFPLLIATLLPVSAHAGVDASADAKCTPVIVDPCGCGKKQDKEDKNKNKDTKECLPDKNMHKCECQSSVKPAGGYCRAQLDCKGTWYRDQNGKKQSIDPNASEKDIAQKIGSLPDSSPEQAVPESPNQQTPSTDALKEDLSKASSDVAKYENALDTAAFGGDPDAVAEMEQSLAEAQAAQADAFQKLNDIAGSESPQAPSAEEAIRAWEDQNQLAADPRNALYQWEDNNMKAAQDAAEKQALYQWDKDQADTFGKQGEEGGPEEPKTWGQIIAKQICEATGFMCSAEAAASQKKLSLYYPGGCTVGVDPGCSPGIEGPKKGSQGNYIDRNTPVIAAGYNSGLKFGDVAKLTNPLTGKSTFAVVGDVCPACGRGFDATPRVLNELGSYGQVNGRGMNVEVVSSGNSWSGGLAQANSLNASGPSGVTSGYGPTGNQVTGTFGNYEGFSGAYVTGPAYNFSPGIEGFQTGSDFVSGGAEGGFDYPDMSYTAPDWSQVAYGSEGDGLYSGPQGGETPWMNDVGFTDYEPGPLASSEGTQIASQPLGSELPSPSDGPGFFSNLINLDFQPLGSGPGIFGDLVSLDFQPTGDGPGIFGDLVSLDFQPGAESPPSGDGSSPLDDALRDFDQAQAAYDEALRADVAARDRLVEAERLLAEAENDPGDNAIEDAKARLREADDIAYNKTAEDLLKAKENLADKTQKLVDAAQKSEDARALDAANREGLAAYREEKNLWQRTLDQFGEWFGVRPDTPPPGFADTEDFGDAPSREAAAEAALAAAEQRLNDAIDDLNAAIQRDAPAAERDALAGIAQKAAEDRDAARREREDFREQALAAADAERRRVQEEGEAAAKPPLPVEVPKVGNATNPSELWEGKIPPVADRGKLYDQLAKEGLVPPVQQYSGREKENLDLMQGLRQREQGAPMPSSEGRGIPPPSDKGRNFYELGDKDPNVRSIQKLLNDNGHPVAKDGFGSPGNETDEFGPRTLGAVKEFQKANGLAADGLVGPQTLKAMNDLSASQSPSADSREIDRLTADAESTSFMGYLQERAGETMDKLVDAIGFKQSPAYDPGDLPSFPGSAQQSWQSSDTGSIDWKALEFNEAFGSVPTSPVTGVEPDFSGVVGVVEPIQSELSNLGEFSPRSPEGERTGLEDFSSFDRGGDPQTLKEAVVRNQIDQDNIARELDTRQFLQQWAETGLAEIQQAAQNVQTWWDDRTREPFGTVSQNSENPPAGQGEQRQQSTPGSDELVAAEREAEANKQAAEIEKGQEDARKAMEKQAATYQGLEDKMAAEKAAQEKSAADQAEKEEKQRREAAAKAKSAIEATKKAMGGAQAAQRNASDEKSGLAALAKVKSAVAQAEKLANDPTLSTADRNFIRTQIDKINGLSNTIRSALSDPYTYGPANGIYSEKAFRAHVNGLANQQTTAANNIIARANYAVSRYVSGASSGSAARATILNARRR